MKLLHFTTLLAVTLTPTLSQKTNVVRTTLQDILLPKNSEQFQIVSDRNLPVTVNRRFAIAENLPRRVKTEMAKNVVVQPQEIILPKNVIVQKNQMATPRKIIVQKSEQIMPNNVIVQNGNQIIMPKNVIVQKGTKSPETIIVQKGKELPRNVIVAKETVQNRVIVQNGNDFSFRKAPLMRPTEVVQQKVLIAKPTVAEMTVPQKVLQNSNPFMPAASPVSGLVPPSNVTPAMPQSRGQFLRKIPIPPPSL